MARINTYKTDLDVQDLDKWIGTDSSTGKTRNFNAQGLANNFNQTGKIGIGGQIPFKSYTGAPNARLEGTISFSEGFGDQTAFSTISSFVFSEKTSGGILVDDYLNYLEDNAIFIYDLSNVNNFAKYNLTSLTPRLSQPGFYDATVVFVEGNGNFSKNTYYGVIEAQSAADKTYIHNQGSSSSVWVINHNLEKYPSVTIVDSGNNVVVGDISYNSTNQLTVTFNAPFSGKAYVN